MAVFLIQYNRVAGSLVNLREFPNRQEADEARLVLEISLNRSRTQHEVVLLEAPDENALRASHRRYFEQISELVAPGARRSGGG